MTQYHQTPSPPRRVDCVVVFLCMCMILICGGAVGRQGRVLSQRMACRANLAVLGKSMAMYCSEYHGRFPHTGAYINDYTNSLNNWTSLDRDSAFSSNGNGHGKTTISSHLYLLVKTMEVSPKTFLCYGEPNVTEFTLVDHVLTVEDALLTFSDVWDFGDANTMEHCSYAYHHPFNASYALTTDSNPQLAVAADRNPWCQDKEARGPAGLGFGNFMPDVPEIGLLMGMPNQGKVGNSDAHDQEGQNVLFVDGHISFETRSYCAVDQDNIYTKAFRFANPQSINRYVGCQLSPENFGHTIPSNALDSLLLNDIKDFTPLPSR